MVASLHAAPRGQDFPSLFPLNVGFAWCDQSEDPGARLLPEENALLGLTASAKRRRDFTLGRCCARTALARLGHGEPGPAPPPILRGEGRKPRWPPGIVGAITHTGGFAAAAVAADGDYLGIGLDLERLGRRTQRLSRKILRPEERLELEALPAEKRDTQATVIFSAKESIYKALNPATGVYLGFQDARIALSGPPDAAEGALNWRLCKSCGPALPAGFTGEGRYARRGDFVLTAVWVAHP